MPPAEEDDLEDLFENAPCGYLSLTPEGRITRCNRTFGRWTGLDPQTLVGTRIQQLLTIAGKIYYETHFAPLLTMQGHFDEVALDIVGADGRKFPSLVNATLRPGGDDRPGFIRLTIFNATDRRHYEQELLDARGRVERARQELTELNLVLETRVAEEVESRLKAEHALHQAQKMEALGQLTGGVAHDFNNMLAGIVGALSIIQRRLSRGDTDVDRFIDGALDSAHRAASLTQRLLAFSRQQPLAPVSLDINRLTAGMADLISRTLGETMRVETVLGAGLWHAKADPSQLENVLLNLSVNARDAMREGGRVTIETSNAFVDEAYARDNQMAEGQYVLVAVSDTGSGISKAIIDKVFDPFFTTKPIGKGTGLGLSQVYGFAKQSGGHVKIYSEVGVGTTVKLYLPRDLRDASPTIAVSSHVPEGSELILFVEDDQRVREFATEGLRELGYSVVSAADGASALLELEHNGAIVLLLTDIVMPGMTGRQLADKALALRPGLKVLYSTGYSRNAIVHNGTLDAGTPLLPKPYSLAELARAVRNALDRP